MFQQLLPGRSLGKTLKSLEIAGFIITENIHLAGSKIPEHAHQNAHFCFVLEGSYSEFHNKREVICEPSNLTFRPPGEVHEDFFHDTDVRVFIIEIPPRWIENLRDSSIRLPRAVKFQSGSLTRLTTQLNREFHQMDVASSLIIEGLSHDSPQAAHLIEDYQPQVLIADKGYDSDPLIEAVTAKGILAVIPPKKSRLVQRDYDQHLYRERHLIECFINKIKHYRQVLSRFDKLSKNYLGFLSFVSALIWLR